MIEDDKTPPGPSQEKVKEVKGPTQEELRQKRLAFLQRLDRTAKGEDAEEGSTESGQTSTEESSLPKGSKSLSQEKPKEEENKEGIYLQHFTRFIYRYIEYHQSD